ncbi:MAG: DegT/DnrJ/EryC1/StrS family aminotransferase, partial [Armatimonadota bacterium]
NAERRRNNEYLSAGLNEMPGIEPVYVAPKCEHVYHIYSPTFVPEEVEGVSRETYVEALAAEGVPIGLGYVRVPIHLRPRHRDRQYFYGKQCPWSCAHRARDVTYRKGDCPTAEHRCQHTELTLSGGVAWRGDQTALADQILAAFEKVAQNLDTLRRIEREKAAS